MARTRTPRSKPAGRSHKADAAASLPAASHRRSFRRKLLVWYDQYGRTLPWRQTSDPYHILVSEIMLQQTQVDRVLPKYHEWLEKYPSFEALAAAPAEDVTRTWYPLGYNIRPRRLHAIAREAVARYGGALPSDESTLRSFKGIGAYTAGAILSFAFRQRAAILDTNVARVLFRVFIGKGHPKTHTMQRRLWTISQTLVPRRRVFDFNQALMDFGAIICTARKPKCLVCPMASVCRAFPFNPENEQRRGPMSASARVVVVVAAVIERDGLFLVTRRQAGTHLEGYWEFPGGKCHAGETLEQALRREIKEELDVEVNGLRKMYETRHSYPERTVELHFYRCSLAGTARPLIGQELQWVPRNDLTALKFPPADAELIMKLIERIL